MRADHDLAVRDRRRRVFLRAGAAAGARRIGRQRSFGRHAADPHAPLDPAQGGRAVGYGGAEETGNIVCRLPRRRFADLFRRIGSRCGCAVRADVRALQSRLLSLPRRVRRSGCPPAPAQCLEQVGFEREDALFPADTRVFEGFDLLREYFAFPRKFLGLNLTALNAALPRLKAKTVDVLFAFDEVNARLAAAVQPEMFALYAAPAINLFEKTADRIPLKSSQHEYHVVPDRSHYLDFEPHRLLEVYAHHPGGRDKVPVKPLYSASLEGAQHASGLYYTVRRLPRRRTVEEKRVGMSSDYTGTDMFISLSALGGEDDDDAISELSVRALCSNRHLTEHLPIGIGGADFRLIDDVTLDLVCVAGPTPPREPIVAPLRSRSEAAHTGTVAWRLVNMLSTNHLGLVERGAGRNAQALRETLTMFAEMTDAATERRIRGVREVDSRPIVRRIRQRSGVGAARGIEITVTIDEKAFEGTGIFLLGAVLDRFFAQYSSFNHFTQTVIRSVERGDVARWPPRMGVHRPL